MRKAQVTSETLKVGVTKVVGFHSNETDDVLSVEEPLEIRITTNNGEPLTRSIAVTMRTPGQDEDLAVGFLFTEGIIADYKQVESIIGNGCNVIAVSLEKGIDVAPQTIDRHSYVASSCGVCGKRSIEAVNARRTYPLAGDEPKVSFDVVKSLPEKLRAAQKAFSTTGGIHASGLFDSSGNLIMVMEDVGRHNALDKLIGAQARMGNLPLADCILLVSGRASFELVQKAAHAGIAVMAAVGAPSSLAVQLAEESGMTLVGFLRDEKFNVYSGAQRLPDLQTADRMVAKA